MLSNASGGRGAAPTLVCWEDPSRFPPLGLPEEEVPAPKPPGRGRYPEIFPVHPPVGPGQELRQVYTGPRWVGKKQGRPRYRTERPKWRAEQALRARPTPNQGFPIFFLLPALQQGVLLATA